MKDEKLGSPTKGKFGYWNIFLWIRDSQKISNLNLLMNWEKLSSYSSFTVKNNIGNLHKIRLLTFQALFLRYSITFIYKHLTMNLGKCSPLWKREFWTHCQFCACCRIFGLRKDPGYLYHLLLIILPKQTTCEVETLASSLHSNFMMNRELNLCKA